MLPEAALASYDAGGDWRIMGGGLAVEHASLLDATTGLVPPGRHAITLSDVYDTLVQAPQFSNSTTRKELWSEWEHHRLIITAYTGEIERIWLAGSFASNKLNPPDIDTTYLIRAEVFDRLNGEDLEMLADATDKSWCIEHDMRIDPYLIRMPENLPFRNLTPSTFNTKTSDSFRDIGLYDEVWQRVHPSLLGENETTSARRGYVEVLL